MTITLSLSDAQAEALRFHAAREGCSIQEVAIRAVEEYLAKIKEAALDTVLDTETVRYADALDRLK